MKTLLLDSSVWVAARNDRERDHEAARRLLATSGTFAALDLTLYEVANVALKRWHSPTSARKLVSLVRDSCMSTIRPIDEQLAKRAVTIAGEQGLSMYDAAYVAASELHDWTLVSGDHRDLVRPGHAIDPAAALSLN